MEVGQQMSDKDKTMVYKVEDIFEDIEGDEKNVLMNIPPEVSEKMGWVEGDTLKFTTKDGNIVIEKVEKKT
jgi:AbrB family looped-hinge helix DNA binding protein